MALFNNKPQEAEEQKVEQEPIGDESYFDGLEGAGLEGMTGDAVSTAYLGMIQPGSSASTTAEPGTWRNSATGENYGSIVRVIPLAFKTVWTERDKDPPYMTVGRYEPRSVEVRVERPKPGARGFPKMFNPETGNKIEELFIYAVLLAEHPEAGILYFSPTVGSMRACKSWNSLLRAQRLPNGKQAPIFAYSWDLVLDLVPNPAKQNVNEKISKFVAVHRGELVAKALFLEHVQPQIVQAPQIAMLAAPEQSGEVEE